MNLFRRKHPDQLERIAREGAGLSRLAHLAALLLVICFSLGSLVALGGEALNHILAGWQAGNVDLPAAISLTVSTLMVLAADIAMLFAASMLRLLATRNGTWRDKFVHWSVIAVVGLLESATFTYMSYLYESPATFAAWALVVARAVAAPLMALYLTQARPLAVTAKDVLHQAELAAGRGVVRDVVAIASQADLPLADKLSLYKASAEMRESDRAKLDAMIDAMPDPDRQPEPPVKLSVVRKPVRSGSREADARAAWDRGARTISQMQQMTGLSRSAAGALGPGIQGRAAKRMRRPTMKRLLREAGLALVYTLLLSDLLTPFVNLFIKLGVSRMHRKSNPLLDTALLMLAISMYAATAHRPDVLVAAALTGVFSLVLGLSLWLVWR